MKKKNAKNSKSIKVAAMADLHMQSSLVGLYQDIFDQVNEEADILVLGGDLTDHGLEEEADLLVEDLRSLRVPVVGVLGNHDYEAERQDAIKKILTKGGVKFLDDEPFVFEGIGFAGIKGFAGGFDHHMLGLFGENSLKDFVYEAINEALKLENSLNKLEEEVEKRVNKKVVVMHYSPVKDTVLGEPEEIFAFLGSSRLAEPIDNFDCTLAIHGHAHFGKYQGKTLKGIPVYNVSQNIVKKEFGKPFAVLEV